MEPHVIDDAFGQRSAQVRQRRSAGTASGVTHEAVRRRNLSSVLRRLHTAGPSSRSELVEWTGLNRSTVADLVEELAARGLASESGPKRSGLPGRPSPIVQVAPNRAVVLVIEILPDALAASFVGLGGEILTRTRQYRGRYPRPFDAEIEAITELAGSLLVTPPAANLFSVAVAVAGVVRREGGMLAIAPNLDWREVAIGSRLRTMLKLDVPVVVANDANLATLAEFTRGSGIGCHEFLCLWGDVGIGSGILVGETLLIGKEGFAGEVGHLPIPTGWPALPLRTARLLGDRDR